MKMKSTILWNAMSEIPYYFETPVPKYFRETGWFKNANTILFVTWAFSRCHTEAHKIVMNGKEITLAPFEFVSGRLTSAKECFLTENQFRNQQNAMLNAGLLKKTTNSLTNHYTCYVWVTDCFSKNNNQPNNQPTTNRPPTDHHNNKNKEISSIEEQQYGPAGPAIIIPSSLQNLKDSSITDKNRIEISSRYTQDVIDLAISCITEPAFKFDGTMLKALRAACKGNWKPNKADVNDIDKNKNLAEAIEGTHNKCNYTACNKHLEIVRGRTVYTILYEMTHEKFCLEIERLGKINLEKALNIL